jgi:hypothetical protein
MISAVQQQKSLQFHKQLVHNDSNSSITSKKKRKLRKKPSSSSPPSIVTSEIVKTKKPKKHQPTPSSTSSVSDTNDSNGNGNTISRMVSWSTMTSIERVVTNHDLVFSIFRNFTTDLLATVMCRVNHEWYRAAYKPQLWSRLVFDHQRHRDLTQELLVSMIKRAGNTLTILSLDWWSWPLDWGTLDLMTHQHYPSFQTLSLKGWMDTVNTSDADHHWSRLVAFVASTRMTLTCLRLAWPIADHPLFFRYQQLSALLVSPTYLDNNNDEPCPEPDCPRTINMRLGEPTPTLRRQCYTCHRIVGCCDTPSIGWCRQCDHSKCMSCTTYSRCNDGLCTSSVGLICSQCDPDLHLCDGTSITEPEHSTCSTCEASCPQCSNRYCQSCQPIFLLPLACRRCEGMEVMHGRGGYRARGQGVPDDDDYGDTGGDHDGTRSEEEDESEDEPIGTDDY